jgi:2TM domain
MDTDDRRLRAPEPVPPGADPAVLSRSEAVKRLEKKRGWTSGMFAYVVVNLFLVGIWAVTGRGYFWPGWVLGGWGIGMVLGFWDAYIRRPISEVDIATEMRRH